LITGYKSQIRISTVSGCNKALWEGIISPLLLNTLSELVLVAGIHVVDICWIFLPTEDAYVLW